MTFAAINNFPRKPSHNGCVGLPHPPRVLTMKLRQTLLVAHLFGLLHGGISFMAIPVPKKAIQGARSPTGGVLLNEQPQGAPEKDQSEDIKPLLLDPFPEAADPMYAVRGPVGESDFVLSRTGGPTKEELSNENLYRILMMRCSDLEVNTLVWKGLGYRFDPEKEEWTNEEVFPKWREKFPTPPDLIGMQRIYSKEIDGPSLKSNQQLVRSVPVDNKQSLKEHLKPLGFTGYKACTICGESMLPQLSKYISTSLTFAASLLSLLSIKRTKMAELIPNKTRRAQCANWLLYYREELFGYSVEELKERRRLKLEAAEKERLQMERDNQDPKSDWKPPVREVY